MNFYDNRETWIDSKENEIFMEKSFFLCWSLCGWRRGERLVGSGVLLGLAGAQRAEWQQPSCYYHSVVAAGGVGHLGCGREEVNLCQVRPSLVSAQQAPNPEQSSCMTAWRGAPRSATPHSVPPALGPAWPGKALSLDLTPNKYQEPLTLCARPDLDARDFQVTGPCPLEPTFLEKEASRGQVNG